MKKLLPILLPIISLSLLTKSCVKEGDFDFGNFGISDKFTYDVPIPLIDSRLTLDELLKNIQGQYVMADKNGLLNLVYQEEFLISFDSLEVVIPDKIVSHNRSIPVPAGLDSIPSYLLPLIPEELRNYQTFKDDSIRISETFSINLSVDDGIRIDSARAETMNFSFEIQTTVRNKVRFDITTPNIVDVSGNPLKVSVLLPETTGYRERTTVNFDLSNHYIIPDNSQPSNLHGLNLDFAIIVFKDTNVTFPYLAPTSASMGFQNISIDLAYGYFGYREFNADMDAISLEIFERFPIDVLEIERATMNISVTNGLGLPVDLTAELATYTPISTDIPAKTLSISERLGYPQTPYEQPTITTFEQEIQELVNIQDLSQLPNLLKSSATIEINPDNNPTIPNFISKNGFVKVAVGAEIPMRLRVGGLVVSDTIPFAGLALTGTVIDAIDLFTIRANIHNGFPLDAAVSLYFLDERYQAIDSIWARIGGDQAVRPIEIIGGKVDPITGRVVEPTPVQIELSLTKSQIENFANTRYFRMVGVLNTSDHEDMMISIFENSDTEGFLRLMLGTRIRVSGRFLNSLDDLRSGADDE